MATKVRLFYINGDRESSFVERMPDTLATDPALTDKWVQERFKKVYGTRPEFVFSAWKLESTEDVHRSKEAPTPSATKIKKPRTPTQASERQKEIEETRQAFKEKAYLVKYQTKSQNPWESTTQWLTKEQYEELEKRNDFVSLKVIAERVDEYKIATVSRQVRVAGKQQTILRQHKLEKQYEVKKAIRRQTHNSPGLVLYIETNSQEASTNIYKFMKKHNIPHLYTGPKTIWFVDGIQLEYGLETVDPFEESAAKQYLSEFSPAQVKFQEINKV
jgi:hypothetical protein